jgi:hypothetical protein
LTVGQSETSLVALASQLRADAADYRERSRRAAASGSAIGTREWLEAAEAALKAAREIEADQ